MRAKGVELIRASNDTNAFGLAAERAKADPVKHGLEMRLLN
jgi:hypothetical protein